VTFAERIAQRPKTTTPAAPVRPTFAERVRARQRERDRLWADAACYLAEMAASSPGRTELEDVAEEYGIPLEELQELDSMPDADRLSARQLMLCFFRGICPSDLVADW
jgi:hypothetical protein